LANQPRGVGYEYHLVFVRSEAFSVSILEEAKPANQSGLQDREEAHVEPQRGFCVASGASVCGGSLPAIWLQSVNGPLQLFDLVWRNPVSAFVTTSKSLPLILIGVGLHEQLSSPGNPETGAGRSIRNI
jgi:hypothetical protein